MKLYATVTSERATKGQGGNKHVLTALTAEIDGIRQEIASLSAVHWEDHYAIEIITPSHRVIKEKLSTKGEKQKGACPCCGETGGHHSDDACEPFKA